MKKTLTYITIVMTALMAASYLISEPKHTGMSLKTVAKADDSLHASSKALSPDQQQLLEEELDYYFERHNVQDEGYEMVVAFANGQRHQVDIPRQVPLTNVGLWDNNLREGTSIVLDSLGRTIVGTCRNNSLETGWRPDSLGIYQGEFAAEKAHGHGAYLTPDGGYFEGHWDNDKRHGFGINLQLSGDDSRLHVGEWTKGRFQGERMKYTSERIYGIDISKYQHGKGRRPVPILWDKLRITNVGKRGSHNVSGTADYPVSFVFIKSTESTTIRNKFYVNDYAQARKRGIPIGAYHFWSMRTSGIDQAQHFLRNTLFKDGDLPPVLDIEPSKSQVEQMGVDRMFMQIRIWLRAVERSTGVKPILYVNQMFVNNYLSKQPDLKRDYCVWIARYSEYKPDLRLAFWQLCPDGHVAGIQGDVDINVFNGYKLQFEKFLEEETIKR